MTGKPRVTELLFLGNDPHPLSQPIMARQYSVFSPGRKRFVILQVTYKFLIKKVHIFKKAFLQQQMHVEEKIDFFFFLTFECLV